MPNYSYQCLRCGLCFEKLQPIVMRGNAFCPDCGSSCNLIPSIPARVVVHEKERLPLGSKSRGRFVSSKETGGLSILIPSFGLMEKEEVDYVAEEAIAEEKERVKTAEPRLGAVALRNVVTETKKAPAGKRKKTLEQITKEGMR